MNSLLLLPIACLALLQTCPPETAENVPADKVPAQVTYSDGNLYLDTGAGRTLLDDSARYSNFTVNEAAGCLVLSSLDESLLPDSWVIGPKRDAEQALHLPGQVLQYKSDACMAFSEIPDMLSDYSSSLSLVNSAGQLIATEHDSWLLAPLIADLAVTEACILSWEPQEDPNAMFSGVSIRLLDTNSGAELSNWQPELAAGLGDAELLYLDDNSGLLLLQYDIYNWEILLCQRQDDSARVIYTLVGQPMFDRALPSQIDSLSRLEMHEGLLELDIISFADGSLRLTIDPGSGICTESPETKTIPAMRNQPFVFGNDPNNESRLEQRLFPMQLGAQWTQDAWLDRAGRLLVLGDDGPAWLEIE